MTLQHDDRRQTAHPVQERHARIGRPRRTIFAFHSKAHCTCKPVLHMDWTRLLLNYLPGVIRFTPGGSRNSKSLSVSGGLSFTLL